MMIGGGEVRTIVHDLASSEFYNRWCPELVNE